MDQNLEQKMKEMEAKIDAIYISVEKTRKYFFWTMVVTLVVFILPLIALTFIIPSFLGNYNEMLQTLGV